MINPSKEQWVPELKCEDALDRGKENQCELLHIKTWNDPVCGETLLRIQVGCQGARQGVHGAHQEVCLGADMGYRRFTGNQSMVQVGPRR